MKWPRDPRTKWPLSQPQLGFLAASRARTRCEYSSSKPRAFVLAGSSGYFAYKFLIIWVQQCTKHSKIKYLNINLWTCSSVYIWTYMPDRKTMDMSQVFSVPASRPRPRCFNKGSKSCKTSGVERPVMDGQETMVRLHGVCRTCLDLFYEILDSVFYIGENMQSWSRLFWIWVWMRRTRWTSTLQVSILIHSIS